MDIETDEKDMNFEKKIDKQLICQELLSKPSILVARFETFFWQSAVSETIFETQILTQLEDGYAQAFADFHYITHNNIPKYIDPSPKYKLEQ
jgi:hypothetical protein